MLTHYAFGMSRKELFIKHHMQKLTKATPQRLRDQNVVLRRAPVLDKICVKCIVVGMLYHRLQGLERVQGVCQKLYSMEGWCVPGIDMERKRSNFHDKVKTIKFTSKELRENCV